MQEKTSILVKNASKTGLRINKEKTKLVRINTNNINSIEIYNTQLENVTSFTYLGSVVNHSGGTEEDVKSRLAKAYTAFGMLGKVWKSKYITIKTKLRILNSNVKSVLLYGSETWSLTMANRKKLQSFLNRCLRNILQIWWPNKITNEDLWRRTNQFPIPQEIKKRKWKWIGHTLRKGRSNITCQALQWTPQGKRKRGRPRLTWRRVLEKEMAEKGHNWNTIHQLAKDREKWRRIVSGLCSTRK
eukprot:XP_011449634.1 PREDICTED: uncharacterized protein LOC105343837 [Crassostrea gigas]